MIREVKQNKYQATMDMLFDIRADVRYSADKRKLKQTIWVTRTTEQPQQTSLAHLN